jgi:hypothetical protein
MREQRRKRGVAPVHKTGERLLVDAMRFAFEHHREQHRSERHPRTGERLPFYEHASSVAKGLVDAGYNHSTVAAGGLHDLERTGKTRGLELARKRFDDVVMGIVDGVTCLDEYHGKKATDPRAKKMQKEAFNEHFLLSSIVYPEIIAVKAVDRGHNFKSIGECSLATQRRMVQDTISLYIPLLEHFDPSLQQMLVDHVEPLRKRHASLLEFTGASSLMILDQLIRGYAKGRLDNYTRAAKESDELLEAFAKQGRDGYASLKARAKEAGIELEGTPIEDAKQVLEHHIQVCGRLRDAHRRVMWVEDAIAEHQAPIDEVIGKASEQTMRMLLRGGYDAPNLPLVDRLDRPLVSPGEGRYVAPEIKWHDDLTRILFSFTRMRQSREFIERYFAKADAHGSVAMPDTPEKTAVLGWFKWCGLSDVWCGTYRTTTYERVSMYQAQGDGRPHREIIDRLNEVMKVGEPAAVLEMDYDNSNTSDPRFVGRTGVRLIYDMLFNAPKIRQEGKTADRDMEISLKTWMVDNPWTIVDIVDP